MTLPSTSVQELDRKRKSLGLPHSATGLCLCDAASVHSCMMFEKLRERFEREANCILLHGSSSTYHPDRVDVPGGWGATGAPNDAFHQWFHYLRRGFMRACSGMSSSLKFRRALQDLDLAADGNTRISMLGVLNNNAGCDTIWCCTALYCTVLITTPEHDMVSDILYSNDLGCRIMQLEYDFKKHNIYVECSMITVLYCTVPMNLSECCAWLAAQDVCGVQCESRLLGITEAVPVR